MEGVPKNHEEILPVMARSEIADFVGERAIKDEDIYLIEKLAAFPKNLIIRELHNLFSLSRENSGHELETLIQGAQEPTVKELLETMQLFYQKYNWAVCWNLVRILETL